MGDYKKREVLELIGRLSQINDLLCKNHPGICESEEILSHCQGTALSIGTWLEKLGGGAEAFVHILESYCEELYQMNGRFSNGSPCADLSDKIREELTRLQEGLSACLPEDKREVVFFPYKASMWDSFESVWRAAKEDEGSEVYVVPIPYFDKNPDGTLGQMHDEGDAYPEDVAVVPWREYRLETRRPDLAFIHNPYDQCNYVTSVHPKFYTRELKKYVEKLVYIPYFVAADDEVDPHFCVTPGALYSDVVVVQSEKVRETYIREQEQWRRENNCSDMPGESQNRIVALGSPKYDRIYSVLESGTPLPEKWEEAIRRADGSRKKVVFYNTSLHSLLSWDERAVKKIEQVLSVFKRERENITLLWRPHPLIPAALQSMRPALWDQYRAVVERYKTEGWGILDDSADAARALAAGDAYYGDGGSLYEVYKELGKPVMLQNVEII